MEAGLKQSDRVDGSAQLVGPEDRDVLGDPASVLDRFVLEQVETDGRFALVEHRLAPRALAAPLHLHTREDEYSFVLEGNVGVFFDGHELVAGVGDLVVKPRGQWHTFWNAGDGTARILEIISPGGLEKLFRLLDESPEMMDPEKLPVLAAEYGAEVDFEGTIPIAHRHDLVF